MSIDVIGNFLTVIRNGIMASKPLIVVSHSKMREQIADILKAKGFVREVTVIDGESNKKNIKVMLKYVDGESVIHEITRISKPSLRAYAGAKRIKPVIGGLGVTIVSTNKGVMTQEKAKAINVGGEVICTVW